jgi:hypothetical protein
MEEWSFLTKHARALICIARDPASRLRDIAAQLDITERSAFGIVNDLATAGYVVKGKDGRRNRYDIQGHLPLRDAVGRERTIGELLQVVAYPPSQPSGRRPVEMRPNARRIPVAAARRSSVPTASTVTRHPPNTGRNSARGGHLE